MTRRSRYAPVLLAMVMAACAEDSLPEPLVPLASIPTFVVRSSDFTSSSFTFLDAEGAVLYEAWVTSGLESGSLSSAIGSDNVHPTKEVGDGTFTIIDRAGSDRITRFQLPEGDVLGQVRTHGDAITSGFASNPQDVAYLSPTRALVTRYGFSEDPLAAPVNQGTDLLELDPSTMTLTGGRIDLSSFNETVVVDGDDGPVERTAYARPVRMVQTENGFLMVGLDRLTGRFEGAADGLLAVVDLGSDEATGYDLAPMKNCGTVFPVPGQPNGFAVLCLGHRTTKAVTSGLVVLDIDDEGVISEVGRWRVADHDGAPNLVGGVLMLSERYFIGVALGQYEDPDAPDVLYLVDLDSDEYTPVWTTEQGFDIFGSMGYLPESGLVLIPSRSEGLLRFRFADGALSFEDDVRIRRLALPVVSVGRIL